MSTPNSRKRPAPGTTPAAPLPHMPILGPGDQMVQWHNGQTNEASYADSNYGILRAPQQYPPHPIVPDTSNTLARKPAGTSRALVPAAQRPIFNGTGDAWPDFGADDSMALQAALHGGLPEDGNIDKLEEMAIKAKREAQGKRKQIPPFVQKLSSFLEERKNEELIRWSDNGDSFIVLDEDEFAKTLIPDMFKHNNYASFVRQLNMYGFHKRVGLSDNSMRASERKNKSPSEYANPFFRRGHPNLLWLINKPKNGSKSKKGPKGVVEADGDSEDDCIGDETHGQIPSGPTTAILGRTQNSELCPTAKKEISTIRNEVGKVKQQQVMVFNALRDIQNNNKQMYQQLVSLQDRYDRHQTSINAILTFLANVFRKTIQDQSASPPNLNEVLAHMMNNTNLQQPGVQQGTVVDLGDINMSQPHHPAQGSNMGMNIPKKARGLLPPIPDQGAASGAADPSLAGLNASSFGMGTVTELFDTPSDTSSPNFIAKELEKNAPEKMMQIIRDTNATASPNLRVPAVVPHVPISPLNLVSDRLEPNLTATRPTSDPIIKTEQPPVSPFGGDASARAPPLPLIPSAAAPILTPTAPSPTSPPPSLTPLMSALPTPGLSLGHLNYDSAEIERLQRLSDDSIIRLHDIQTRIGGLSPEINLDMDAYFSGPADLTEEQLDFYASMPEFANGHHVDFDADFLDHTGLSPFTHLDVPATAGASASIPSPSVTDEELAHDGGGERASKRRREA